MLWYASRRRTEGQTPSGPAYQEWIWPSRGHTHNMAVPYLLRWAPSIVNTTSLTDVNNIDILRVDLNGISVTSVYKPPGERFSFHQPLTARDQHQVIIGDFNSHSSTWGYATTNTDGELVEDWAENQILRLIHDPKLPSSFYSGRWRRGYNPDIIFATNRIAGCCNKIVMEPVSRSQHRPIGVQVNAAITVQTVPFRRRFNLRKANWEQYAYQLDAAVENIPATAECYDQFVNALRKVARKNTPRGCRRNYVPGLTPESIELIKEYREKYEDDPFADSTITIGEELMSAISEERRKAWQTLIESTDMTHNSKKAWSTIRKLCDDPCKPEAALQHHCEPSGTPTPTQRKSTGQATESTPRSTAIPGRPGIHESIYCSGTRHRHQSTEERQSTRPG